MPFYRKKTTMVKGPKYTPFLPKYRKKQSVASKKYRQDRFQKRPADPEVKYFSNTTGSGLVSTTAYVNLMNASTQGAGNGQVIGQRARMTSFQIRGMYANSPTALTASTGLYGAAESFRVVVVYDKQCNGAAATWSAVFNQNSPWAMRSLDTRDRFVTLYDSGVQTISAAGPNSWVLDEFRKISLEMTKTTTNNGNITDIITGSMYCMVISNNFNANNASTFAAVLRVNYEDE